MTISPSQAQDDNTQPADPVLEALKREQAIAEAKKAIAEAEGATLAAQLPSSEGSGIAGDSTFGEDSGYLAQILAYRSLRLAARAIVDELGASTSEVLLVADANLGRQGQLWEIAKLRIEDAKSKLERLRKQYPTVLGSDEELGGIGATATAAAAILRAASDIASFFRTDLNVTSASVQVPSASLLAEMAATLSCKGWKPIIPSLRLEKTMLLTAVDELLQEHRDLSGHRSELAKSIQPDLIELGRKRIEIVAAKNALKAAKAANPPNSDVVEGAERALENIETDIMGLEVKEAAWERVASEIDAALAATDTLVKALVEGGEGKPSPIESLVAVDFIKSRKDLKILQLEISSQGGEIHATKTAWKNRLTYLGGVAITYFLVDHEGKPESSGIVAIPIAHSSRVKRLNDALPAVAPVACKG